jgi:hypothetical protein
MFEKIESPLKISPEENMSVFNPLYWSFWWLNSIIVLGNKKALEQTVNT